MGFSPCGRVDPLVTEHRIIYAASLDPTIYSDTDRHSERPNLARGICSTQVQIPPCSG